MKSHQKLLPLGSLLCLAIAAQSSAQAQNQTVTGDLAVTGTADIEGNDLTLGTTPNSGGAPGVQVSYIPPAGAGLPHSINFAATPNATIWRWLSAGHTQLSLGGSGGDLVLYDASGYAGVTLSTSDVSVFNSGLTTYGLLTATAGVNIPSDSWLDIGGARLGVAGNMLHAQSPFTTDWYIEANGHIRAGGDGVFGGLVVKPNNPAGSDDFSIRNTYVGGVSSEVRLIAGDNALEPYETDRVSIGATDWQTGDWYPRFTVMSKGNVGIGTDAPAAPLHISGPNPTNEFLRFTVSSPSTSNSTFGIGGYDTSLIGRINFNRWGDSEFDTGVTLGSAFNPNLLTLRGFRVGIGNTAPTEVLDVNGNTIIRGALILPPFQSSTFTNRLEVPGNIRLYDGDIRIDRTSGTDPFFIRNINEGNHNSEFRLIAGDNGLEPYETDRLSIGATDWRTGNWYPRFTVTALGNVGIGTGTTTPTQKLQVVGNAVVSGTLTVGGQLVATTNQLSGMLTGASSLPAANLTGTVPTASLPANLTQLGATVELNSGETTGNLAWSRVDKTGASLADLPAREFASLQAKPTNLAGYGITDAVAKDASGNVAIAGTTTLNGAVTVNEVATFNRRVAKLRVERQGDISMGLFTAGSEIP